MTVDLGFITTSRSSPSPRASPGAGAKLGIGRYRKEDLLLVKQLVERESTGR